MSERFWRHLSVTFGWLAIGLLFCLVTFSSSLEIKDLDLWLHLRMGWWIWQHGFVPHYDVLSCTIAGKPWVNHEWLFQVLVYLVQRAYGFNGLISMQSLVVGATFLFLLFLGYSRERQWLSVVSLLMVLMVYQTRFTIRPDIFSILFFVLYIYVLSLHINKRWALYALVGLQIIWANTHGFFFFGPLLVAVAILSEFLKRRVPMPYEWNTTGRLTDGEYRSLKILFPLLILACCVNPDTFKGAWYPVKVFFSLSGSNKIFFKHIVELQRPITAQNIFTNMWMYYKALIVVSFLSFVFNRRKIDVSSLLVWAIFLAFSLAAIRNMVFFAVAAYMVLMVNAISISWKNVVPLHFSSPKFKYLTVIIIEIILMLWMMNFGIQMSSNGYFDFDTYGRKSEFFGVSKRVYPYEAVNFLVAQKIKGNFFNDFNSGAYLVGRVDPAVKVFIDGRTEEYGAKFFENYQKIWMQGNAKVFEQFERKDNITGAFLNNAHQEIPPACLKMFHSFKDWSIVYLDYDGVIFLKKTPYNMPFIRKFSVDIHHWVPKPMNLYKLGTKLVTPFPFVNRAYILETLDADEAAIREAREALAVAPDYGQAYHILAKIYTKRHEYKKAFVNYRLAAIYTGDLPSILGLAHAYEELKHYDGAIDEYRRVLSIFPRNIEGYFGLARCLAKEGKDKKALAMIDKAKKLGLEDKVDVQKIHDIINGKKKKVFINKQYFKRRK
ncbi:MAG: tetratricopeptide repeat protein [Candidatus Omnitrophica bacterium]|nr:tetratricopeptide repeat protein [Candidatus Omnitrophota bacterium]MDE2008747.1 tetratricopeptide repeat protein [Candidatus Omnitrophota bacterium]MDE2215171.1 tetratricopeptide repeat protein [Candidatus Omnitrophota bacterium]MDE2232174.1 tetratricopeptide repeat protein [Candidatus Omnitrophota bacterium]